MTNLQFLTENYDYRKLVRWKMKSSVIVFHLKSHLSSLSGYPSLHCGVKNVTFSHLNSLISHFDKYFFEDMDKYKWIRNSFVGNAIAPQGFTSFEAEQFIGLSSDLTLKSICSTNSTISFWILARFQFPLVSRKSLRILIPFATLYLCKAGFSSVAIIKSKYRNKIDNECETQVAISNIKPRFDKMCMGQQAYCSHKII